MKDAFVFVSYVVLYSRSVLASALKALYEKGIVHRDLKPQNILLCHSGRPNPPISEITLKIGELSSEIIARFVCILQLMVDVESELL